MSQQSKFPVRETVCYETQQSNHALSELLNTWLTNHGPSAIFRTCDSCKFMSQEGPTFCQLYNMTPPVKVVLSGCPSHQDNSEIPF